jgi:hypothetical protein
MRPLRNLKLNSDCVEEKAALKPSRAQVYVVNRAPPQTKCLSLGAAAEINTTQTRSSSDYLRVMLVERYTVALWCTGIMGSLSDVGW